MKFLESKLLAAGLGAEVPQLRLRYATTTKFLNSARLAAELRALAPRPRYAKTLKFMNSMAAGLGAG